MVLVGLTGNIGSGKTTFGTYLGAAAGSYLQLEASEPITEVANSLRRKTEYYPNAHDIDEINKWLAVLPDILEDLSGKKVDSANLLIKKTDVTKKPRLYSKLFEYLELVSNHPELAEGDINLNNKSDHRPLLQWFGGYVAKKVDGKFWFQELIRRAHQADNKALVGVGGVRFPADAETIKVAGGFIIELKRPELAQKDSTDITEAERHSIQPDITIVNDGTLANLKFCATKVWEDMPKSNHVEYRASDCNK